MQTTMELLERAQRETRMNLSDLARVLGLNDNALHAAKNREHLSPAVAGALADHVGEDYKDWIVTAALESEKDSACKDRMVRRLRREKPSFYLPLANNGPRTGRLPASRGCSGYTTRNHAIFTTSCVTPKRAAMLR
jgi:hypothetical protein